MRQLIEKVELHDTLNPKIWENDKLKTEVKDKLEEIIDQFILELHDNDIPVKVLDARLVGSNASFNYTENSDMDVHLIVNTQEASCDTNVLTLLYNYFKSNFNDKYDISIHGIPVELYIEDVGASAVSNGIYSIYDDEWIKYPEPVDVPDIDITDDFAVLERRYKNIIEDNDAEEAEELLDELYLRRKDSLATEGEYGRDNLLFKQFRSEGYLDGLKEVLNGITSKELSLEALMESAHEDDDTYYRVEIRTADGYQGGLFHTIDRVVDTEEEYDIDSAEYELGYLIGELEDTLGNAPEINNSDAIFAYKEDELLKIYDILQDIQGLLGGFDAELIIREIHNPKKIEYEDDKQVAVVERLLEAKEDNQKLIDYVGEETANKFFKLKSRIKSPQNDLYYWLKKEPFELQDFLNDLESVKSKTQQAKEDKSGADLIYNSDGWKIYKINTYNASKYYGKGTKWCISGNYSGHEERGEEYFNSYKKQGVLNYYFIFSPGSHKWCYLETTDSFIGSRLWDETNNGVNNYFDTVIPDLPKDALYKLPGYYKYINIDGIYDSLVKSVIETNVLIFNKFESEILSQKLGYTTNSNISNKQWSGKIKEIIVGGDVDSIEAFTFMNLKNLTKVVINDGVKEIKTSAFENCPKLTDVILPESIELIGRNAFSGCKKLKKIYLPKSIKYVGAFAFAECDKKLTILCGFTEDFSKKTFSAFWNSFDDPDIKYNCVFEYVPRVAEKIIYGTINESKADEQKLVDFVGDEYANIFFALKKQGRLKSPQNDIYYWLKKNPQELRDFLMDMHLTRSNSEQRKIDKSGADLVYNKDGWKIYRIDTYDSAKYYGKGTKWCISGNYPGSEGQGEEYFNDYKNRGVKDYYFIINPENHKWCYLDVQSGFPDSILWDEEDNGVDDIYDDTIPNFPKDALNSIPGMKETIIIEGPIVNLFRTIKDNNGWLVVDDDTQLVIDSMSTSDIKQLGHIIKGVKIIGGNDYIQSGVFYISDIEKLIIGDGIRVIGSNAFKNCKKLNYVRLPSTIQKIYTNAFYGCTSLTKLYIPSSVRYIESYAFEGCDNLSITCGVSQEYADSHYDSFWDVKKIGSIEDGYDVIPVTYNKSESLTEDLKTKEWAVDKFSKAFLKYMPNMPSSKLMLQAKLKDLDESEWKKIVDFVNSISFPLTVYRGLKLENEEALDVKDLGVNWTVDDTLFFAPNSSFKNSNYVVKGQITEDDIDWEETVQNFVYYSLRPQYGFYPENEVTLKKNFTLQNPELFRKDGNSLVLVKTLNESLVVESRNHMDIEEMIEQAYYRHPKPEEIFEEPWDELVDPKQFYSDLTKGASPEYKARARKQILMNTEKDLIYNVLLGYLDSLGTGNTDYMKLEPAIAKKIDGKIVPQDGGHRAVLCKMLGMRLPVKFVETYQESVDRTVYNALYAFPKYVEKYGKGSALFELKYKYNLQDDELVWIINKLIDSGRIDMFTRDSYISQLGLEDYEEDIKKVIEEDYLDDEEKFWDYHTANISGNQVFDETTQESSYGKKFLDLAKSGKSDSKGRKAKIIKMTPMQYFEGCALGFGTSVQSQIRQVKNDKGTLDLLNDVIDKYHKRFPITYLDFSGETFGQEGRHRMYVAGERYGWDTKFPVLVIYSGKEPDYGRYKRAGYDREEDEEIETVDIDIDDIDLEDLAIFEALEEFGDSKGVKIFL